MILELDGRLMADRKTVHEFLAERLRFPDYYGRNLDGLYDLLTEISEPVEIRISHAAQMELLLGPYAGLLIDTLHDAQRSNPNLTVTITANN